MEKELMVLVGPVGSGKSTLANELKTSSTIIISQDLMGKKRHLEIFKDAVNQGISRVIVDRMNFNREQRSRYIDFARARGYVITIIELFYDPDECVRRVGNRERHPTIKKGNFELAAEIINMYESMYERPEPDEYDNYNQVEV